MRFFLIKYGNDKIQRGQSKGVRPLCFFVEEWGEFEGGQAPLFFAEEWGEFERCLTPSQEKASDDTKKNCVG